MTEQHPPARMRTLMTRIQTDGAEAAFEAAQDILKDKSAAAAARASAINSVWRAGGYFDNKRDGMVKPPEEMTAAEVSARISQLRAESERLAAGETSDDDQGEDDKPNDLFG